MRKVLAEASGDIGVNDSDSEEDFHDASHLADNDLTRPSDWRPSSTTSGMLDIILITYLIRGNYSFLVFANPPPTNMSFITLTGRFLYVLSSKPHNLPPLRFHCVVGGWDRTQDCCELAIVCQTL